MNQFDFCIIGGGVVGNAIARELSKFQFSIALLEKGNDVALGCTKANSGILHGGYDSTNGTLKSKLEYRGNQLYEKWNEELEFGLDRCGSLVLAFSEKEESILLKLKKNGELNGINNLEIISKKAILEQEPNINTDVRVAMQCRHTGVISPYEVAIALAENASCNGVQFFLNTEVLSIYRNDTSSSYTWTIESSVQKFQAKHIINCAGVHSDEIAKMIGIDKYSITPRRGSYYIFQRGYMPIKKILFQTPTQKGKGVLVSPTYHGNLLIGPDAEVISDKDDTIPPQERLEFIVNTAKLTLPSLDIKKHIRSYAGIRPTSHTKDFIINQDYERFLNLVGIDSPGLTSSPAIAEYVINLLSQNGYTFTKRQDYNPQRKKIIIRQKDKKFMDMKSINNLSQLQQGDEQRIICKCEQVYERTILYAMHRQPYAKSVDAIKRRTRAGMGICQGKFCRPRTKEILANEWNMSKDDVPEK